MAFRLIKGTFHVAGCELGAAAEDGSFRRDFRAFPHHAQGVAFASLNRLPEELRNFLRYRPLRKAIRTLLGELAKESSEPKVS